RADHVAGYDGNRAFKERMVDEGVGNVKRC
ncbi:MAG: hypothetical protein QOI51_1852, partial [Nocardioidaceae bacterium]|nr:hypothetical protein [Nocardioidaceae bacterium]